MSRYARTSLANAEGNVTTNSGTTRKRYKTIHTDSEVFLQDIEVLFEGVEDTSIYLHYFV